MLPLYILYLPIKRSPQQQQVKEHSTQEKEHSTQEKEHFTQEKEHFTQEQKPANPHEHWIFRNSQNPNILSIDNQLIIKPQCPPALMGRAML